MYIDGINSVWYFFNFEILSIQWQTLNLTDVSPFFFHVNLVITVSSLVCVRTSNMYWCGLVYWKKKNNWDKTSHRAWKKVISKFGQHLAGILRNCIGFQHFCVHMHTMYALRYVYAIAYTHIVRIKISVRKFRDFCPRLTKLREHTKY